MGNPISRPQWKHRITDVDEVAGVGTCSTCGRVGVRRSKRSSGVYGWRCRVAFNQHRPTNRNSGQRRRSKARRYLRDHCERCGFVPEHRCQLDVHHRDGDSRNEDPRNFQTLCANCHRLFTHAVIEQSDGQVREHLAIENRAGSAAQKAG